MIAGTCHATDVDGISYAAPDTLTMRKVLASLDEAEGADHPDVSLVHDNGWSLSVTESGTILWENLRESEAHRPIQHLRGAGREKALTLWQALAEGRFAAIEAEPWQALPA